MEQMIMATRAQGRCSRRPDGARYRAEALRGSFLQHSSGRYRGRKERRIVPCF